MPECGLSVNYLSIAIFLLNQGRQIKLHTHSLLGVNNMRLTAKNLFTLVLIGCSTIACAQTSQLTPKRSDITKVLSLKLAESSAVYADKLKTCEAIADQQPASPVINSAELEKRGISRDEAVVATAHLYFKNKTLCSQTEMLDFAYQLGNIHHLKDEMEIDASIIEQANAFAPYQTARELQLEVQFNQLNSSTKQFFNDALGTQPFDYLELLERF